MTNLERVIVCCLVFTLGFAVAMTTHRATDRTDGAEELTADGEVTLLIRETCGLDENARCQDLTRRCVRACKGIGGRMVELAPRFTEPPSVSVRHDVCVCASPEGIDRYSSDFSVHERVTQTYCLDVE